MITTTKRSAALLCLILTLTILQTGCGGAEEAGSQPASGEPAASAEKTSVSRDLPLSEQIDALIEQDRYEDALARLEGMDAENPDIRVLFEKTHLNYGLHSMMTFDQTEMRTRMNRALRQFTRVLELNPANQIAREQIDQILMIYGTMPDRSPDPDVLEGLRGVGYAI